MVLVREREREREREKRLSREVCVFVLWCKKPMKSNSLAFDGDGGDEYLNSRASRIVYFSLVVRVATRDGRFGSVDKSMAS